MSNKKISPNAHANWQFYLAAGAMAAGCATLIASSILLGCNELATNAGAGKLYSDSASIPHRQVGVVLGCSAKIGQRNNQYFIRRIDAASQLYHAGKVDCLIVSGDNSRHDYDEPADMKQALIEKGVPAEKIVCDYAGLRTLDSIVRAKKVFGQDSFTVISQQFQNERSAYIAQAHNIDLIGFNAAGVHGRVARHTDRREFLARTKMWLDVQFFNTSPKYLGPLETLPIDS
ncbi:SanA/YdcF family protein [Persicirhabdus sediminis]|uniref:YdcF family protein n=1 Tax=Persicirhabdus sediminis TaxID=454144 RepID=A0A8J7SKX6_9BACT|nr:ElyC/SanA/YdcF family protein [Persicirhabdus sediminis]MBK1792011.1 YdcF family protein [Persicirhabdus sediminis]